MKITIESTDRIVEVLSGQSDVLCRIWEGRTESGIPVQCMILRVATPADHDQTQFLKELKECRPPEMPEEIFPLRMVL